MANDGKLHVTPKFMDTREAIQAILNGKEHPALWSPSGSRWATALADAWTKTHAGEPNPIRANDSESYRTYLRTPLVFLTTRDKAASLGKALVADSRSSWAALHELRIHPLPGKATRFSHPDPRSSSVGFATLGMFLADYARIAKNTDVSKAANDLGFVGYLADMKSYSVSDPSFRGDATVLCNAFAENRLVADMVVVSKSDALATCAKHPELAVLYPSPTTAADQSVAVLEAK